MSGERKPPGVYGVGEEPDPRFTLANERTALAWMRTSLALVVGGVALISVTSIARLPKWSSVVAGLACAGGAALAYRSVTGWARAERALRLRQPLPAPRALTFLALGVGALAVLALVLSVVELRR